MIENYNVWKMSIQRIYDYYSNDCVNIIKSFAERGISVNINPYGERIYHLHHCAGHNSKDCLEYLLQLGESPNCKNSNKETPLHFAAYWEALNCLQLLLSCEDIDINAQTDGGYTALHMAAMKERIDIIKCLIDSGADITLQCKKGKTFLEYLNEDLKKEMEDYIQQYDVIASLDIKEPCC